MGLWRSLPMTSQSTTQPITGPLFARALGLQPRLAQWLMWPRAQAYLLIKLFLILIHGCSQVEGAFLVINAWITPYLHCTHLRHIMAPMATRAERVHSIQYLSLYQLSHGTFQKCPRSRGLHRGPEDPYILNGQPGPNLLLLVPGLFNIVCNTRVDRRTQHPPEISVSQHACV